MNSSDDKCKLRLLGITYNQIESGVYALILQEEEGAQRHIPIIVGFAEAQSIEVKLQQMATERPLTHDLILDMLDRFGMKLTEVYIYRLPSGVFAAELSITDKYGIIYHIDARSSDGVALAMRAGTPIFTSRKMIDEVGFIPGQRPIRNRQSRVAYSSQNAKTRRPVNSNFSSTIEVEPFAGLSTTDLQVKMMQAAENEDYEMAARIKEEIDRRSNRPNNSNTPQNL